MGKPSAASRRAADLQAQRIAQSRSERRRRAYTMLAGVLTAFVLLGIGTMLWHHWHPARAGSSAPAVQQVLAGTHHAAPAAAQAEEAG